MKKVYLKRVALALGFVALSVSAYAEEGTWHSVTNEYLKNPSMITPSWNGGFCDLMTDEANGLAAGEAWSAPMGISQLIDLPAGHYKLTAHAFYRNGDEANTAAHLNAYIYLGTAKATVMSLYADKNGITPNSLTEAADAFKAGRFLNTVEFDHAGGNLRFGLDSPVFVWDEWTAFGYFKLEGPNGAVEIPNGDFLKGKVDPQNCGWDNMNFAGSPKYPDFLFLGKEDFNQWNACVSGTFRKAGGSPYNHGQLVELPAGKYRFGAQSFIRYGCGNQSGWWVPFKNGWDGDAGKGLKEEGQSAYDIHVANAEDASWESYLYATDGVMEYEGVAYKPKDAATAETYKAGSFYNTKAIKCLFDEPAIGGKYPDNAPDINGIVGDGHGYVNSGFETEAIEYLLKNPESYRNYVEFELAAPGKVWVGIKKDTNSPSGYWSPYREFTLEKFEAAGSFVNEIAADENAPIEYYNLQGVRIANPESGLYIVKQGNKVTKKIIK